MKNGIKHIFIIAGEESGDTHSASLISKLRKKYGELSVAGIGGNNLRSEKVKTLFDIREVNYIGFSSVFRNLPKLKKIFNDCIEYIRKNNPDLIILVDFPGFNLKFASEARKFYKGKIIYYISPQLWAWHKSRVNTVRKYIDKMIVLFPFEVDFYKREGVNADFGGHPLIEKAQDFLNNYKSTEREHINIGLMPGSREEEIRKILPVIYKAAKKLSYEYYAEIKILRPENVKEKLYYEIIKDKEPLIISNRQDEYTNFKFIKESALLYAKSGTSNLECALIGSPFCTVYNTTKLNYAIGKALINVKFLSIVNLLAGKQVVEEFIQKNMTEQNLYNEGKRILTDYQYRNNMLNEFKKIKETLSSDKLKHTAEEIISTYLNK